MRLISLFAFVFAMTATSAASAADLKGWADQYRCSELQALVARDGVLNIRWSWLVGRTYFSTTEACFESDMTIEAYEKTADKASCFLGYRCFPGSGG